MAINLLQLGLPVRDQERSMRFYATWFGFDPHGARRYPDGTVILRNPDGFDLALHPGQAPEQPAFLHFGFQMPDAGAVHELLARMEADRVPVPEALGGAGLRRVQMPGPGRLAGGGRLGADRLSAATTAVGAWCA